MASMRSKCSPCLPRELVGPVRGADGHGQRVAAAAFDELDGLVGIGQAGVIGRDVMSSSTPPSMPNSASTEIPFSWARSTTRRVMAMFFVERLVRGVDHHRRIEAAVDAVVADFFGAVIEMDGEDRIGKDLFGRPDHRLPEIACR